MNKPDSPTFHAALTATHGYSSSQSRAAARTLRVVDKMDPDTRHAISSAGGRARAAADPTELFAARGAGGSAANRPASLARRIVKQWPTLTRAERAEVRAILGPLMPRA